MEKEERETIILINIADKDDGYFRFYTTERNEYERLVKKVGGKDHLIHVDEDRGWSCGGAKVWRCRLSRSTAVHRRPAQRDI